MPIELSEPAVVEIANSDFEALDSAQCTIPRVTPKPQETAPTPEIAEINRSGFAEVVLEDQPKVSTTSVARRMLLPMDPTNPS
eukprot:g6382.t1